MLERISNESHRLQFSLGVVLPLLDGLLDREQHLFLVAQPFQIRIELLGILRPWVNAIVEADSFLLKLSSLSRLGDLLFVLALELLFKECSILATRL